MKVFSADRPKTSAGFDRLIRHQAPLLHRLEKFCLLANETGQFDPQHCFRHG